MYEELEKMKKLIIGMVAVMIIVIVLAAFALTYKPTVRPTAAAVEGAAIDLVQQEMEQAIANITEQDIENALTQ